MYTISPDRTRVFVNNPQEDFLPAAMAIGPQSMRMMAAANVVLANGPHEQVIGKLWGRNDARYNQETIRLKYELQIGKTVHFEAGTSVDKAYCQSQSPFYTFLWYGVCCLTDENVLLLSPHLGFTTRDQIIKTVYCLGPYQGADWDHTCSTYEYDTDGGLARLRGGIQTNNLADLFQDPDGPIPMEKKKTPIKKTPPVDMIEVLTRLFGAKIAKNLIIRF